MPKSGLQSLILSPSKSEKPNPIAGLSLPPLISACSWESPIGPMVVGTTDNAVWGITIGEEGENELFRRAESLGVTIQRKTNALGKEAIRELHEYFSRKRKEFTVPILLYGTPFQIRVWRELCRVPFGSVIAYGELAARTDHSQAARAVGGAMARNRIPLIVPCHRVIAGNGGLGGFGCGLDAKQYLLDLEK